MTTSRRHRWAVPAVVLVLTGVTTTACDDNSPPDAVIGSPVAAAAAVRAVQALETDPGFAQETTVADGWRPLCVARPMGIAPDATSAAEVSTVYAWIYCKWVPAAGATPVPDPAGLPGLTTPIAVYPGPDLLYDLPADGADREESIKGMFPANLREIAIGGSPEAGTAIQELDARVARELSK